MINNMIATSVAVQTVFWQLWCVSRLWKVLPFFLQ